MHVKEVAQRTISVVYIEADPSNAFLMQSALSCKPDYAVHHADTAIGGLEFCRNNKPALVITAMRLPDLTAYQVLVALQSHPTTQGVPCVVLSGDARPSEIERALDAGFNDYWIKPVNVTRILKKIDEHVAISRSASQDGAA